MMSEKKKIQKQIVTRMKYAKHTSSWVRVRGLGGRSACLIAGRRGKVTYITSKSSCWFPKRCACPKVWLEYVKEKREKSIR